VTARTRRWLRRQRALLADVPAPRFLDVGCSEGAVVAAAAEAGFAAAGVELEPEAASRARARGLAVVAGKLGDLPQDETYHLMRMNQLLEHVASPRELLRQARARLAEGGLLRIVTPNAAGHAHRVLGAAWRHLGGERNGHLCLFSPTALRRCAHGAGLEVVSLSTRGLRAWSRRGPGGLRRIGWRLLEQALYVRLGERGDELVAVLRRR
jgi:SAM-dependent methyltransferase